VARRGLTGWVRNMRARGGGELRLGARREPIRVVELPDDRKPEVLRAYLRRWSFEVGVFFQGVGPDAPEAELRRIAPELVRLMVGAMQLEARLHVDLKIGTNWEDMHPLVLEEAPASLRGA
jgi:hypothetical protein